jgi:uncharacterized protein (TIGR02284 family)
MTADYQKVQKVLGTLYRMAEASTRGYAAAAANMADPAIKILFKFYAQQRAAHVAELLVELRRLGGDIKPGHSIPAMVHRGRVNIFAAMTIERDRHDKVILQEVLLGEKFALRSYRRALEEELSPRARTLVQAQLTEIRRANQQVELLRDQKSVVRRFDPANPGPQCLVEMGGTLQKISLNESDLYRGRGATVPETVLAGAVGGALWGGLTGLLVGFGVLQTTSPAPSGLPEVMAIWALVAFGFLLLGAFVASGLALFIGVNVSEEDTIAPPANGGPYQLLIQTQETAAYRAGSTSKVTESGL